MTSLSQTANGTIERFLHTLSNAGFTMEDIQAITSDDDKSLASGMLAVLKCEEWVKVTTFHPRIAWTRVAPDLSVRLPRQLGRRDTITGVIVEFLDTDGSRLPEYEVELLADEWTVLSHNWEAKLAANRSVSIRRIPDNFWVNMTPGWEADFSEVGAYHLRPAW